MSKKYDLLTFEDFFMNFLLELKFLILSHPVTSKQPHKIVQILLTHPVCPRKTLFQHTVPLGQKKVIFQMGLLNLIHCVQVQLTLFIYMRKTWKKKNQIERQFYVFTFFSIGAWLHYTEEKKVDLSKKYCRGFALFISDHKFVLVFD